jgi:hypothetical protein
MVQNSPQQADNPLDQTIYDSLKNYEQQIQVLKGQVKLLNWKLEKEQVASAYWKILINGTNKISQEGFTEEEQKHLAEVIAS